MSDTIHFTIDGRPVTAKPGETILNVARREGIYIPTMCYLEKTEPAASCRLCVVECDGVDGMILSCQTPPTEGLAVTTDNAALHEERTNIMRLYDVNHPLECGVCDKSGACDLQNKTLEFNVGEQLFTAKDQPRHNKKWGFINYDPSLCIMCEKCTHVCNEIIGDDAIELQYGGYKSTIVPKNAETLDCTFCGECIAVCPVGALISADFQYTANAWELEPVPSTCAHCSAGCALHYEVKTFGAGTTGQEKIFRVTNNFEYVTLCGAGRFGFDFDVQGRKDAQQLDAAVAAIEKADAIRFSSVITNEEALLLQRFKEKYGLKLFNEDARRFAAFVDAFRSVDTSDKAFATTEALKKATGIVVVGSRIATDNPGVRYAMTEAARHHGAKIAYMHPMEDTLLQNTVTQFVKYEVGTEEGVMALLADVLLEGKELTKKARAFLDGLDEGYLSAESNVGEEELAALRRSLTRSKDNVLVLGSDLFAHPRAENIAKIAALIARFGGFKVLFVPRDVNTAGVAAICDLDEPCDVASAVGYNAPGDFVIAADADADLVVPALNQQEGTVVSIDRRVLPLNAALGFEGYELNDLANACGIGEALTVDLTERLPEAAGFKAAAFDELENFHSPLGEDRRGYVLAWPKARVTGEPDAVQELPEFNGTVVYRCDPVRQFNAFTARTEQLTDERGVFYGSAQFATAARVGDGDRVAIESSGGRRERVFRLDESLKGTVALEPTFDTPFGAGTDAYRFEKVKIMKVSNDE